MRSAATASEPYTVTLSWSPDQNGGRVSVLNGRAPVWALVARLRAGDPVEGVAADFGVTVQQLEVLCRLAQDAPVLDLPA